MPLNISSFLTATAELFLRGDIDALAARFTTPLPIYTANSIEFFENGGALGRELARYRAHLWRRGVGQIAIDNVVIEDLSAGRCLLRLDWQYQSDTGEILKHQRCRLVLQTGTTPAQYRIEMIELLSRVEEPHAYDCFAATETAIAKPH